MGRRASGACGAAEPGLGLGLHSLWDFFKCRIALFV